MWLTTPATGAGRTSQPVAEVQVNPAPLCKLYVLNGADAFSGFYPAVERTATIKGKRVGIYDLMGKDCTLFHYTASDDDSPETQFIQSSARGARVV